MTGRCIRCGWHKAQTLSGDLGDNHDRFCPDGPKLRNQPWAEVMYENGYDAGRAGRELHPQAQPVFRLGWRRGTVAFEEANC